ncbi:hypothetical protein WN943_008195 [Citrus x changshan-huyou]
MAINQDNIFEAAMYSVGRLGWAKPSCIHCLKISAFNQYDVVLLQASPTNALPLLLCFSSVTFIVCLNNLLGGYCPSVEWPEAIINHTLFSYSETVQNLSIFFNCSGGFTSVGKNNFSYPSEDGIVNGFYTIDDSRGSLLENRAALHKSC